MTPDQLAKSGSEHGEQMALFAWASLRVQDTQGLSVLRWLFAIPNGGLRHAAEANKLKAEGVKKGVSDVFLPVPSQQWAGLFIEMKKRTGKPSDQSPDQRAFQTFVEAQHYRYVLCYCWEHAREAITSYLGMTL